MERRNGNSSELQHRAVARVEAFSEGVQQWPSYVAFALTFTLVGTVWANHRLAFS